MAGKRGREYLVLGGLIGLFVVLASYYALSSPLYSRPDEPCHYAYTLYLKEGLGLPVVDMSHVGARNDRPVEMEAHQPPLYYAAVAALSAPVPAGLDPAPEMNPYFLTTPEDKRNLWLASYVTSPLEAPTFYVGRLFSVVCGAAALLFAYLLIRLFLPWPLAALTVAFMGFNPQFLFISSSFSNDMASTATAHLGLWQVGLALRDGLTPRRGIIAGLAVALATLTKVGGFGLLGLLVLVALWQAWRQRQLVPVWGAALGAAVVAVGGSWWFWHNWQVYGNPLALNVLSVLLGPAPGPPSWTELSALLQWIAQSFWLDFGPAGFVFAEPVFYWLVGGLFLLGLAGSLVYLVAARPSGSPRPFGERVRVRGRLDAGQGGRPQGPALHVRGEAPLPLAASTDAAPPARRVRGEAPLSPVGQGLVPCRPSGLAGEDTDPHPYPLPRRERESGSGREREKETAPGRAGAQALFLLVWLWFIVVAAAMLSITLSTGIVMGGGRLLLPAAVAVALTVAVGTTEVFARRWPASAGLALALVVFAALAPGRYTDPRYPQLAVAASLEQTPTYATDAYFADGAFQMLGYDLQLVDDPAAGQSLAVTYYWRTLKGSDRDLSVFLHLLGQEGLDPVVRSQFDTYPAYGAFPTGRWRSGNIVVDHLSLPLPPPGKPADGEVITGFYDRQGDERVQGVDAAGKDLPYWSAVLAKVQTLPSGRRQVLAQGQVIGEVAGMPEMSSPAGAAYGDRLTLAGLHLEGEEAKSGQPLKVYLYWQARAVPPEDYVLSLQLFDASGAMRAQVDGPAGGAYPTGRWQAGETVVEARSMPLPADLPAGQYELRAILYSYPSLARLPVTGAGPGADYASLALVTVR
ncbi:MAG: glycosyltransferase family 39 protein [Chloroflexota bacterium]